MENRDFSWQVIVTANVSLVTFIGILFSMHCHHVPLQISYDAQLLVALVALVANCVTGDCNGAYCFGCICLDFVQLSVICFSSRQMTLHKSKSHWLQGGQVELSLHGVKLCCG